MQEWLDNNDILMYRARNEGKSVIAERFIKSFKVEIYKKMTANDNKSCLSYLNKVIILIIVLLIENLLMLVILL